MHTSLSNERIMADIESIVVCEKNKDWIFEKARVTTTLLTDVKRRKLRYFGHMIRKPYRDAAGNRRKGRPLVSWLDNVMMWTSPNVQQCIRKVED